MVFNARAVETSSVILMLIKEDIIAKADQTKEITMVTGITTVIIITSNNNHL